MARRVLHSLFRGKEWLSGVLAWAPHAAFRLKPEATLPRRGEPSLSASAGLPPSGGRLREASHRLATATAFRLKPEATHACVGLKPEATHAEARATAAPSLRSTLLRCALQARPPRSGALRRPAPLRRASPSSGGAAGRRRCGAPRCEPPSRSSCRHQMRRHPPGAVHLRRRGGVLHVQQTLDPSSRTAHH